MTVESASYLNDANSALPDGADSKSEGDNHLRLLKTILKATFPGMAGRAWRTQSKSSGYTAIATDNMSVLRFTASATLTMTAVGTLGNGWVCALIAPSGVTITIDGDGTEEINGAATFDVVGPAMALLFASAVASDEFYCGVFPLSTPATLATAQTLTNKTHTNPGHTDQTLTDQATIDWDMSLGGIATVTLGGNRTMAAPTNLKKGTYILHVIQDGTGTRTLTWNGVFKWAGAVAPVLSTTGGRRDVFSFICDGTNLHGSYIPDSR